MHRITITLAVLIIFIAWKINGECKPRNPPKHAEECKKYKSEGLCKQMAALGLVDCYWDDGKGKKKQKEKSKNKHKPKKSKQKKNKPQQNPADYRRNCCFSFTDEYKQYCREKAPKKCDKNVNCFWGYIRSPLYIFTHLFADVNENGKSEIFEFKTEKDVWTQKRIDEQNELYLYEKKRNDPSRFVGREWNEFFYSEKYGNVRKDTFGLWDRCGSHYELQFIPLGEALRSS